MKVLIGDDKYGIPGKRKERFLQEYGGLAEFYFTNDPKCFIQQAKTGEYGALMIDLNWYCEDDLTGFSVLEILLDCKTKKILWTGQVGFEYVAEAFESGADYFLHKHPTFKELKETFNS